MIRLLSVLAFTLAMGPREAAAVGMPQGATARQDTVNLCLECHATQREAAEVGVHSEAGVRCVDCHGGNPRIADLPGAHQGRFLGNATKAQTAQLCGSCHSDPNLMREYALPTGQLAEFRTSKHGQLLLGGQNKDAPTCTDCHGTHIIYPPDDARSHVYPTNIPGTCAKCHSDDKLMAKYHLKTGQFEDFRTSAHGDALYRQQNFAAPTCVGCHGAHSALPPTVSEIGNVCARCHQLVGKAFAAGPHGPVAVGGRISACLACHSNHGTEVAAVDELSALCDKCHATDARLHQMGVDLQHRMTRLNRDMESSRKAIAELQATGHRVDDFKFRYQTALTNYLQVAKVQHRLNLEEMDDLERRVRSISVELTSAVESARGERFDHKLLLIPVWFLALSTVALAWLSLRSLKGERPKRDS